jgi:hypothetical protein
VGKSGETIPPSAEGTSTRLFQVDSHGPSLMDGSCQLKLKPCWGPSVTTVRGREPPRKVLTVVYARSRSRCGGRGPAGAAPHIGSHPIMIFDNLIEADFISQSVYSYTGARPNTLPSSHMRHAHGHAEHAAVGRSTAGLTTRNLKLLFRFQEIQRPPLYECAARREAGRFLPYRESFY